MNVRLIHARALDDTEAREEYHIRFRVPDTIALNAADERFIKTLVLNEVRHTNLELFKGQACGPARPCEIHRCAG